jgi:hypothetical protein
MNFFRSEDHARRWVDFTPEHAGGLVPLAKVVALMNAPMTRERLNGRYVSSAPGYLRGFVQHVQEVMGGDPYWAVPSRKDPR